MLFKNLFSWLNRDLSGKSWYAEAQHHYFGQIGYYGFKDQRIGYWECEVEFDDSIVSVIINSPKEELPTKTHQEFVESILNDRDKITEQIKPMMLDMLAQWLEFNRDTDWYQLFKLSAIEVPIYGDAKNNWEISFECLADKEGHNLTCAFKNGSLEYVSVDG